MITDLKESFDYNNGELISKFSNNQFKSGRSVGVVDSSGYKRLVFKGQRYLLHRLIFAYHHGYFPQYVDHINRDRLDNRIENLRDVNPYESSLNRDVEKRDLPKGVYRKLNRYISVINIKGRTRFLGSFMTPEEAQEVYGLAYEMLHPKHKELYQEGDGFA